MSENPYQAPQSNTINDEAIIVELASRFVRLLAYLIDSLLVIIPGFIYFYLTDWFGKFWESAGASMEILVSLEAVLVYWVLWFVFNAYFLYRNGQTVGKLLLGIKIVRTDDSVASLLRLMGRYYVFQFLQIIPILGFFSWLLDPMWIFNEDRRCLHDLFADTKVIIA